MHDLKHVTALGGATPRTDDIGTITIKESADVALASVAARNGQAKACVKALKKLLQADAPGPGKAVLHDPIAGFWMGPDQWMLAAPLDGHEMLADDLKATLGAAASVTEQTGAWVVFDVSGAAVRDMFELLCAVPVRRMAASDAQRTLIHQIGCFVIRLSGEDEIRILGPRSSAGSLHHALITAARSVA